MQLRGMFEHKSKHSNHDTTVLSLRGCKTYVPENGGRLSIFKGRFARGGARNFPMEG